MSTDFESARRKYKPGIKFLLVAEAPPREDSGRFFYFENVSTGDSLFLETMKVLYPKDYTKTKIVRQRKQEFLERFKGDGFYLIDSCDSPMEDSSPTKKRKQIQKALPSLRSKLRELATDGVKIVLISATVYEVCNDILKSEGFNIINEELIDFPGSGGQKKFREKFGNLLKKNGWVIRA
ncbi:TPA: hypothetical protein ENS27_05745 [bacterium]|nr:hypothetical protein [bacterium]